MGEVTFSTIQVHPFYIKDGVAKFIILKRSNEAKIYAGMWQVVTGRIEIGEKAYEAAIREVSEETRANVINLYHIPFVGSFYDWRKDKIEQIPCFATEIDGEIIISNEHSEYKIVEYDELFNYLVLPSHIIGSEFLKKHIIDNPNRNNYIIKK